MNELISKDSLPVSLEDIMSEVFDLIPIENDILPTEIAAMRGNYHVVKNSIITPRKLNHSEVLYRLNIYHQILSGLGRN